MSRLPGSFMVVVLLLGPGCAAGKYYDAAREIRVQNPHAALEYIGKCLQVDPNHAEALDLIPEIAIAIGSEHEAKVEAMVAAGSYEEAVADCDRVIAAAYLVRSMPGNKQIPHLAKERAALAGKAAQKFYDIGIKAEQGKQHKQAALAYSRALGFRLDYKDSRQRFLASQASATTRVVIKPFDRGPSGPIVARVLTQSIAASAMEKKPLFLRIVRDRGHASAHCTGGVQLGNYYDSGWVSKTGEQEVEISKTDENTNESYTVKRKASWTLYSREISYELTASFSVEDLESGGILASDTASSQASDSRAYAKWSGDKEAVPSNILSLPSSRPGMKNRKTLASECARSVGEELGYKLFLAFK